MEGGNYGGFDCAYEMFEFMNCLKRWMDGWMHKGMLWMDISVVGRLGGKLSFPGKWVCKYIYIHPCEH